MYSIVITWILVIPIMTNFPTVKSFDCSQPLPDLRLEECCAEPKMERTSISDTCASDHLANDQNGGVAQGMACFAECLFNATGLLKNGEVDTKRALAVIQNKLAKDPDYIPVMKQSFQKCVPLAQSKLSKASKRFRTRKCYPLAKLIMDCVQRENFANCPSSKWTHSKQCENAKEYATKCI